MTGPGIKVGALAGLDTALDRKNEKFGLGRQDGWIQKLSDPYDSERLRKCKT